MADVRITSLPEPAGAGGVRITSVPEQSLSLGDVATGAVENFVPSAKQMGADLWQVVRHPVRTAKSLGDLAVGVAQLTIEGEQGKEEVAREVGRFFKDRYGGIENVKRTAATDPVGFAADLATVLTGAGGAAVRLPGTAGRVAKVAQTAGRAIDPTILAGRAAGAVARPIGRGTAAALGVTTGAGGQSITEAARAGFAGGEQARAFRESIAGRVSPQDLVNQAQGAVDNLRNARAATYVDEINKIGQSPELVEMARVREAFNTTVGRFSREGRLPLKVEKVKQKVDKILAEWEDMSEAHSPYQLDLMRQDLRDLQQQFAPKRDSRHAFVTALRDDVGRAIEEAAPGYSQVLGGYAEASDVIDELQRTLALNPKATVDTQFRKLSSSLRNNVNASFGQRTRLIGELEAAGAQNLTSQLAGSTLQPLAPRGISRAVAGTTGAAGLFDPTFFAALPAQSPRIVGEAAAAGGTAARFAEPLARVQGLPALGAFQAGRATDVQTQPLPIGPLLQQLLRPR